MREVERKFPTLEHKSDEGATRRRLRQAIQRVTGSPAGATDIDEEEKADLEATLHLIGQSDQIWSGLVMGKGGLLRLTTEALRTLLVRSGAVPERLATRGAYGTKCPVRSMGEDEASSLMAVESLEDVLEAKDLREVVDWFREYHTLVHGFGQELLLQGVPAEVGGLDALLALKGLLDRHRDERRVQAAIVYEFGRGGPRRHSRWSRTEVARSYDVAVSEIRGWGAKAVRLLVEAGLRVA